MSNKLKNFVELTFEYGEGYTEKVLFNINLIDRIFTSSGWYSLGSSVVSVNGKEYTIKETVQEVIKLIEAASK